MTRITYIILAIAALLYLLAMPGIYTIVGAPNSGGPGFAYRLNRYTGAVAFCTPAECTEIKTP